jgi:hypothetical protein
LKEAFFFVKKAFSSCLVWQKLFSLCLVWQKLFSLSAAWEESLKRPNKTAVLLLFYCYFAAALLLLYCFVFVR